MHNGFARLSHEALEDMAVPMSSTHLLRLSLSPYIRVFMTVNSNSNQKLRMFIPREIFKLNLLKLTAMCTSGSVGMCTIHFLMTRYTLLKGVHQVLFD